MGEEKEVKNIGVIYQLPPDLAATIKHIAIDEGVSYSAVAIRLLRAGLRQEGKS